MSHDHHHQLLTRKKNKTKNKTRTESKKKSALKKENDLMVNLGAAARFTSKRKKYNAELTFLIDR